MKKILCVGTIDTLIGTCVIAYACFMKKTYFVLKDFLHENA